MDRDDGFREQYCNKINDYLGERIRTCADRSRNTVRAQEHMVLAAFRCQQPEQAEQDPVGV